MVIEYTTSFGKLFNTIAHGAQKKVDTCDDSTAGSTPCETIGTKVDENSFLSNFFRSNYRAYYGNLHQDAVGGLFASVNKAMFEAHKAESDTDGLAEFEITKGTTSWDAAEMLVQKKIEELNADGDDSNDIRVKDGSTTLVRAAKGTEGTEEFAPSNMTENYAGDRNLDKNATFQKLTAYVVKLMDEKNDKLELTDGGKKMKGWNSFTKNDQGEKVPVTIDLKSVYEAMDAKFFETHLKEVKPATP